MSSNTLEQRSLRLEAALLEAAYWQAVVEDTYAYTTSPKARRKAEASYREALEEAKRIAEEEQADEHETT